MATVAKMPIQGKPEHATINWLNECISRGQRGVFTEHKIIGPGVASALLNSNPNNRNLVERRVAQYVADMAAGLWMYNGEAIIVADTGELNDGQHRLQAIIESNRPQLMAVTFGVSRESRITVDQGAARTSAHYLAMEGVKNAAMCAGIARIVITFEQTRGQSFKGDVTNAEVVARVHSDSDIPAAAEFTDHVRKYARGALSPSQIGACYYLFHDVHPADARDYMTQLCVGENIKRGDPAFTIRQALDNMKGDRRGDRIELAMRGFVAFRQGRKLQIAKVLGTFPALV